MAGIEISFNGEPRVVQSKTLQDLLEEFGLAGKKVAVERNLKIVPRGTYESVDLVAGDSIEVVHFVGGG